MQYKVVEVEAATSRDDRKFSRTADISSEFRNVIDTYASQGWVYVDNIVHQAYYDRDQVSGCKKGCSTVTPKPAVVEYHYYLVFVKTDDSKKTISTTSKKQSNK